MPTPGFDSHAARGGADLSNWRTVPFSRWAFRNVREIMPTAGVQNEPASLWDIPARHEEFDGFRLRLASGAEYDLPAFLTATATDGLAVIWQGRFVLEFYANGNTARTHHILMSATKSLVGLLCGNLAARRELDVDADLVRYLPEMAGTAFAGASVRQLLDMRTGVSFDADLTAAYNAATGWEPVAPGAAASDLRGFFESLPKGAATHGGPFRHLSANTDLLGWLLERAAGAPLATLFGEHLWKAMGAESEAYLSIDRSGLARATGGLCATLRDFARIGQLLVENGQRQGVEVVPPAWLEDILARGDKDAWRQGDFAQGFAAFSMSYRSGWYVVDSAPQMLFAMGIHGQNLFVDRAHGIVVAKVSSQNEPTDPKSIALTLRAFGEIRRVLVRR